MTKVIYACEDIYSQELHARAVDKRADSARLLVARAAMSETERVFDASDDEWLITEDFLRTQSPSLNFASAISYVEALDMVRQYESIGLTFSRPTETEGEAI